MLCVIAKLEEAARARLLAVQAAATRLGIPPRPLHGHITLVSYVGGDEADLIARCKDTLAPYRPFSVRYEETAVLAATSIIAALPQKSAQLCQLHDCLAALAPEELDPWSQAEVWLPHTTLVCHGTADLQAAAQRMRAEFAPFDAQITGIEFSRVTGSGYTVVDAFPFAGADPAGCPPCGPCGVTAP